jgi:hypothetical protein
MAEVASIVGASDVAEVLLEQLHPYAHLFCVEGIGAAFTGSVNWYLAMLARTVGRAREAEMFELDARAAHERVGLVGDPPPLASGQQRQAPPAPILPARASLVYEGATWAVTFGGATHRLRDSKGLHDLAILLARADQEVHCLELVGGADVGGDTGPTLDPRARQAYEQRIRDLHDDIEAARVNNDPVRAERAEAELDALVQQLSEAFGLSGRARPKGAAAERARTTVTSRVRAAIRHAGEVDAALGRHLQRSVRTGMWCAYRPELNIAWEVDAGRSGGPRPTS